MRKKLSTLRTLILAIAGTCAGCAIVVTDVSTRPEYANLIGESFTLRWQKNYYLYHDGCGLLIEPAEEIVDGHTKKIKTIEQPLVVKIVGIQRQSVRDTSIDYPIVSFTDSATKQVIRARAQFGFFSELDGRKLGLPSPLGKP